MAWINPPKAPSMLPGFIRMNVAPPTKGALRDMVAGMATQSAQLGALSVAGRTSLYFANHLLPNVIPGPDEMIRLYHSGFLGFEELDKAIREHGIRFQTSDVGNNAVPQWKRLLTLARSKPDDGTILDLYLRDNITGREADDRLKELGYSIERERKLLLSLESQLTPDFVHSLLMRGTILRPEAEKQMRKLGYLDDDYVKWMLDQLTPIDYTLIITLLNRGLIDFFDADELLKRSGVSIPEERFNLLKLAEIIPPPTDLVRFVVKDVFDERIVAEMGWDDEYEDQRERYEFWCKAQGLGESDLPGNPDGVPINWPRLYYRANWQNISPTQSYIALHRLRPTTSTTGGPRNPNGVVFTRADMERILRISDYPKRQRDWLIETSYQPLTRVDLRRMYDLGSLGDKAPDRPFDPLDSESTALSSPASRELFESYQDLGYQAHDAAKLTHFTISEERTRRSKQTLGNARAAIADAYKVGVISWQEAAIRLYRLRLDDPTRRAAFDNLNRTEQEAIVRADPATMQALAQLDLQADTQMVKEWVRSIRTAYVTGRWGRNEAEGQLRTLGIVESRAQRYLDLWDARKSGSRKMLTVDKITGYARRDIIGLAEMETRLINLGYSEEDTRAIRREVARQRIADALREDERSARTQQQLARAIERQAIQQQRQQAALIRRLQRLGTPSQLSRWVVRGLLGADSMLARLLSDGVSRLDAEAKVAEAVQLRDERLARLARGTSSA